jgi:lysozyme
MSNPILIIGIAAAATMLLLQNQNQNQSSVDNSGTDSSEGIIDTAQTALDEVIGTVAGASSAGDMVTSQSMLDMLKRLERLVLTRYALDDGGYTWGYGHYDKNPNALPATITRDQAESIFADDVTNRGEKWVKLYVTVPLSQNQFDALVSIAFNMSPASFKKFAVQVNAGNGIDGIAAQSVAWVSPKYTNGIQNRRNRELDVFNNGVYA